MKQIDGRAWWWGLPLLALLLGAADYAREWTLALATPDAGAYRVTLEVPVYRVAVDPALRDVDVMDADGRPVPASLAREAEHDVAQVASDTVDLAWFDLPGIDSLPNADLSVASARSEDGRVLKVEVQAPTRSVTPTARNWLVDASALRRPVVALHMHFAEGQDMRASLRVEGSDDLQQWRRLNGGTELLRLSRGGKSVEQLRIPLDGSTRYLRVIASETHLPSLSRISGEFAANAAAADLRWLDLQPVRRSADGKSYEFDLDGRFPIQRADIQMPGNAAGTWRLESRDTNEEAWQWRAGPWTLFQLAAAERSAAQLLGDVSRHRHWRLTSAVASTQTPTLRLGYTPETLIFVAAGKPPYRVVAGSLRARRAQAPLEDLLAQVRGRHSPQWQPERALIILDQTQPINASALQPSRRPLNWKQIALWVLLVAGAALVGGLAWSLLRDKSAGIPPRGEFD